MSFVRRNRAIVSAYLIAVAMFAITSLSTESFASSSNIRFLLLSATFIGMVGLGQTFVILGGGVDLSIPYTMTTVSMLTAVWCHGQNGPLAWVLPIVLGIAVLIGLVNGVGVAVFQVSPIIMTLAVNVILQGLLLVYVGTQQPGPAPAFLRDLTTWHVGPLPAAALIWLVATAIATVVLSFTSFGRRLYAIGTNRVVSELSGVRVVPVQIATYVVSAVTAAIAGLLVAGFAGQAYLGLGDPYLFASVAAVAVGGAPLLGGSGHYLGTVAGALVLTLLAGLLPIFHLKPGWTQIIYGVLILATVALATVRGSAARLA